MDVVVSDVPEDGVDGGELEGAVVLREVTIRLIGGVVLPHRNAVFRQRTGVLVNV